MSFILDALRKSEHERQRQTGPMMANPYAPAQRAPFPLPLPWIIGLGALLLVNLVVLLVFMLRGEPQVAAAPPPVQSPPAAAPAPVEGVAPAPVDAVAPAAQANEPLTAEEMTAGPPLQAQGAVLAPPLEPAAVMPEPPLENLPTLQELNVAGRGLPDMHMDMHVYADTPAERFVFLNARKYREGDETREGLMVERITTAGVVLDRDGLRFLLPRP